MLLVNDLSSKVALNYSAITEAIDRVLKSGRFILGPEVSRFESSFAEYIGVENCVTVASGSDAIELGLKALGIKKGHRVATVANAGMYTMTALSAIGARPFFLDVDLKTYNTNIQEVQRAIDSGVDGIVVTHLYGLAISEIGMISEICRKNKIPLLEDCSQAHGALVDGKRVGNFGDIGAFSFYPTKNLGALGDGGAIVTNKPTIANDVMRLRQYGWKEKYKVEFEGGRNSRLDELQAAILSSILPKLDDENELRRNIAFRYTHEILNPKIILPFHNGYDYVAHLYVIRCSNRNGLRSFLANLGISSDVHYPIPDHKQPVFGDQYADIKLCNTEQLAREILTLPCYPGMEYSAVSRIISVINEWTDDSRMQE